MSELSGSQTRAGRFLFIKFNRILNMLVFSVFVGSDVRFLPISTSDFMNSFCGASLGAYKLKKLVSPIKICTIAYLPHKNRQSYVPVNRLLCRAPTRSRYNRCRKLFLSTDLPDTIALVSGTFSSASENHRSVDQSRQIVI